MCLKQVSNISTFITEAKIFLLKHRAMESILGGSDDGESACNAGDQGLIPGLGRSPGEGHDFPLQYSGLVNSMDRGAWRATVHRIAKSWTVGHLSDYTHTHINA